MFHQNSRYAELVNKNEKMEYEYHDDNLYKHQHDTVGLSRIGHAEEYTKNI